MKIGLVSGLCGVVAAIVFSPLVSAQEDPAQVAIGERLFLETRFAQFFFTNCAGDVNTNLPAGDPVMNETRTVGSPFAGPFAGRSMNCRACHLVDEQAARRTYADFARRSPIPDRGDGAQVTPRNSPGLLGTKPFGNGSPLLHTDGEFVNGIELVKGTFTGRNFGWLPREEAAAIAHIAKVVREDDGTGELAQEFGGSYRAVLSGTDSTVPAELRLPPRFRLNVATASNEQVLDAVARLVNAYLKQLQFAREQKRFIASPYDVFVRSNGLPASPDRGESQSAFSARLLRRLNSLSGPRFVTTNDGAFISHEQPFVFGTTELEGLKIFLRQQPLPGSANGAGNCAACHAPPRFTDLSFHNTGITQEEYDAIFGPGSFAALQIPSFAERATNPGLWLPATSQRPDGSGIFRGVPDAAHPGRTDLGVWNIFANEDHPRVQPYLKRQLRRSGAENSPAAMLERGIASFKTPSVRDPGHSGPYMHNGSKDTIEEVLRFYVSASGQARAGELRNTDPELRRVRLSSEDVAAVAAFLRSLNEDYE